MTAPRRRVCLTLRTLALSAALTWPAPARGEPFTRVAHSRSLPSPRRTPLTAHVGLPGGVDTQPCVL